MTRPDHRPGRLPLGAPASVAVGVFVAAGLLFGCGRIGFAPRPIDSGPGGMDAGTAPPAARCGDGRLDGDEVCDDGNTADGDGCRGDCAKREVCGDGVRDALEGCDDGNDVSHDGCENDCTPSCTLDAECDDARSCNGLEACDTGLGRCVPGTPLADGTACDAAGICRAGLCAPVSCGDVSVDPGEQCDDGNLEPGDGCEADCTWSCEVRDDCDDGRFCNGAEACDEATHTCLVPDAGLPDGTACDRDGSADTRDVCIGSVCHPSVCGDGVVDPDLSPPEQCEDGNSVNGDGCDNDCTFSCEADAECRDAEACNGTESCDLGLHRCVRSRPLEDGTICNEGLGRCAASRCVMLSMDAGPVPVDAGPVPVDSGPSPFDSGIVCPETLTADSPIECFKVCTTSADCVHVQSSCCCSCTEGGTSDAVNGAHMGLYDLRRSASCGSCTGILCLDVLRCPTSGPTCVAGQCVPGPTGGAEI